MLPRIVTLGQSAVLPPRNTHAPDATLHDSSRTTAASKELHASSPVFAPASLAHLGDALFLPSGRLRVPAVPCSSHVLSYTAPTHTSRPGFVGCHPLWPALGGGKETGLDLTRRGLVAQASRPTAMPSVSSPAAPPRGSGRPPSSTLRSHAPGEPTPACRPPPRPATSRSGGCARLRWRALGVGRVLGAAVPSTTVTRPPPRLPTWASPKPPLDCVPRISMVILRGRGPAAANKAEEGGGLGRLSGRGGPHDARDHPTSEATQMARPGPTAASRRCPGCWRWRGQPGGDR